MNCATEARARMLRAPILRARSIESVVDTRVRDADHKAKECPRFRRDAVMSGRSAVASLAVAAALLSGGPAFAGKVLLKNGTELEGDLVPIKAFDARQEKQQAGEVATTPYLLIDDEYRRYVVGDRNVADIDKGQKLVPYDFFDLPQKKSHADLQLASIGLPKSVTPFDEWGRRTVTFNTGNDRVREVVQGVTRVGPQYVTLQGTNFVWWQGIATSALPPDQLSAMIRKSIDPANPDDRMSVVRFYIQAGLYEPAATELEEISKDFPFLAAKVAELNRDLLQLRARLLLAELRARQAAGQHRLALDVARAFPAELGFDAEVLRQVQELRARYDADREKGDLAVLSLGELEARLEDSSKRAEVAALRPIVREQLDWDGLSRLEAFLKFAADETMPPEERLALAYSGWVVGSAKATTDLTKALGLWRARHLVCEYLRSTDSGRRAEVVEELGRIEGVGAESIVDLIPLLPAWNETPDVAPGRISVLETTETVPGWGGDPDEASENAVQIAAPIRYAVMLPPEYTPTRAYPMLVALRPSEWTIEQGAEFWGIGRDGAGREAPGPATRAGYVVIVPEYAGPLQGEYRYTTREHAAVLAAIRDARKRFVIDSDRVFLTGHGMGADATFDVAMSHPDLFAGAAPISGLSRYFTKYYWKNAELVPFYVVNGELDRGARSVNAGDMSQRMKQGYDVLFCEYVGRGYEYYQEELANIFAWMGRLRRAPDPKAVEASVLRTCDDRFYWVKAEGIPRSALLADVAAARPGRGVSPMTLKAEITPGNTIRVAGGATRTVLRLNADLIDRDERVEVRRGARRVFNGFVVPDAGVLLDDLAENGDRQRLYPVRLVVE